MRSPQEANGITSISYHIYVSHTKTSCYRETLKSHAIAQPANNQGFISYPIHQFQFKNTSYKSTTSYTRHLEKQNNI